MINIKKGCPVHIAFLLIVLNYTIIPQEVKIPDLIYESLETLQESGEKVVGEDYILTHYIVEGRINKDEKTDYVMVAEGYWKKKRVTGFIQIFLSENNGYKGAMNLSLLMTDHTLGTIGEIIVEGIYNKTVYVTIKWWDNDDLECCPTISDKFEFWAEGNEVVTNKEIKQKIEIIENTKKFVKAGYFEYEVENIEFTKTIYNALVSKKADGIYLIVYLNVTNIDKESRDIIINWFKLLDIEGYEFEVSKDANDLLYLKEPEKIIPLGKTLQPKITKKIIVPFEVPTENTKYLLRVAGGWWTGEENFIWIN